MHLKTQLVTEIPFTGRTLNSTVLSTKWTCECVCVYVCFCSTASGSAWSFQDTSETETRPHRKDHAV